MEIYKNEDTCSNNGCLWYSSHLECFIYILLSHAKIGYLDSLAAGTFPMRFQVYSEASPMWLSFFLFALQTPSLDISAFVP